MADVTDKAEAAANQLYKALDQPLELERVTAEQLLKAAQSASQRRPHPQSAKVAAGFSTASGIIRGPSGSLGAITLGSELGSTTYAQFHGRSARGSWLFPALDNPPAEVEQAQSAWLDKVTHG